MTIKLYSELRTFYENSDESPNTYRVALKMKDLIDGSLLRRAVNQTMLRYPYFCVRLCIIDNQPCFEENSFAVPVFSSNSSNERRVLGGEETKGHLICFSYFHNYIYIDVWHGLTDGGGLAPLLKTLLYYYCSAFYGTILNHEGVRLYDSEIQQAEWDDPVKNFNVLNENQIVPCKKWNKPAFQLQDGGIANLTRTCIVYNLLILEETFMRFNFSNDGSPATIVSLLLARSIDELHPNSLLPPVIAMCVNQRKALHSPFAHQSLVGDVRLPYTEKIKKLKFSTQATCFRGIVSLQSDNDVILSDIRDYQELIEHLNTLESIRERQQFCREEQEKLSRCISAVVSYVGKSDLGEAGKYVQQCGAITSTALPGVQVPLTIEMSVVNGNFLLSFIQYFNEVDYFSKFVSELRENEIEYIIDSVECAGFPVMKI